MRKNLIIVLCVVFVLLSMAVAALILVRPMVLDSRRRDFQHLLLREIQAGNDTTVLPGIPAVAGEGAAFGELSLGPADETQAIIQGCGVLRIPDLDLCVPVSQGPDRYALRAGAVWDCQSAAFGDAEVCTIFGYRLSDSQWPLNCLDEVKEGDEITLSSMDGTDTVYTVLRCEVTGARDAAGKMAAFQEEQGLILVSDLPAGLRSHRLLIFAAVDTSVG